jgi:hypothetical protein
MDASRIAMDERVLIVDLGNPIYGKTIAIKRKGALFPVRLS